MPAVKREASESSGEDELASHSVSSSPTPKKSPSKKGRTTPSKVMREEVDGDDTRQSPRAILAHMVIEAGLQAVNRTEASEAVSVSPTVFGAPDMTDDQTGSSKQWIADQMKKGTNRSNLRKALLSFAKTL